MSGGEPPAKIPCFSSDFDEEDIFDPLDPFQYIYTEPSLEIEDEEEKGTEIVESLSDIDDEEIDALIATEQEARMNEIIWNSLNKDWEVLQKGKWQPLHFSSADTNKFANLYFIGKEDLEGPNKRTVKKREPKAVAGTPVEAVSAALSRRLVSSKINLSAVEKLVQSSEDVRFFLSILFHKLFLTILI